MGVKINTETEHSEINRTHEYKDNMSYKNKSENELLQMIAKDTNRTAKNVAFYFWVSMISVGFAVLAVVTEVIFGAAVFPGQ